MYILYLQIILKRLCKGVLVTQSQPFNSHFGIRGDGVGVKAKLWCCVAFSGDKFSDYEFRSRISSTFSCQ